MALSNFQLHYFPEIPYKTWLFTTKQGPSTVKHFPRLGTKDLQQNCHKHRKCNLHSALGPESISFPQASELEVLDQDGESIEGYIGYIRETLDTMGDGRTSISPYDTAWIAIVKNLDGLELPQFPSSLEWIANNQLSDGSWGDGNFFLAYDRLLNTLACVVALRSWNVHAQKIYKGIIFIKENMHKLESVEAENMPCGFEIVFPALLQRATNLGIVGIPYDSPVLKDIYSARDRKMKRIPKDLMHTVPTSLLFSLEGLQDLDWKRLLKLQTPLGSFLTSPSSTAFALMETKDGNCFRYLDDIVNKFNGGAPHSYPADLFPRLWAIDRLQRLGISRFFESQVTDFLNYVYRFWTDDGIFSARYSRFCDVDDTSMAFRLLRLHGFSVNSDVFEHFKIDNKFSCYAGQMIESATPIYNLYRASQVQFQGENILEQAAEFSYSFLQEKLKSKKLLDKWIISKGLSDEIRKGLEFPWYADLPRIEARFYIEQYGGETDVWIGKTLYRMPDISNNVYLNLAKLDYNICQAQHQTEWNELQDNLHEFGMTKKYLLRAYFLAAASIFEPERSNERLAWAKSNIITYCFDQNTTSSKQMIASLANYFRNNNGLSKTKSCNIGHGILKIVLTTLDQFSKDTWRILGRDVSHQLHHAWGAWLMNLNEGINCNNEAELFVNTINICAGHIVSKETIVHPEYKSLSNLTQKICQQLRQYQDEKVLGLDNHSARNNSIKCSTNVELDMQALVELVVCESNVVNKKVKETFLMVARTFYYEAYCSPETVDFHIFKVLFEQVV